MITLSVSNPGLEVRTELTVSADAGEHEWDAFVAAQPSASGYHVWRWSRVFERAFGHETLYLAARAAGAIVGVLPLVTMRSRLFGRFMVSLPFVNYGGLVVSDPCATDALVAAAKREADARGLAHIELRHDERRMPDLPVRQHKVAMTLALPQGVEAAWNGLDRKVRNQVRKAQKSGLTTEIGGADLVTAFYGVFARNMRDLGTPVYGRRFFDEVLDAFPGQMRVVVVRQGALTVAAGIGYEHDGILEVPWASSLKEYRALCANNLLYWSFIEDAAARGLKTLDFGRSTPGEGTYEFKRQWGAVARPLFWEYALVGTRALPDHSPANPKFQAAIAMWKRLPVPVATLIGPRIVRSIP